MITKHRRNKQRVPETYTAPRDPGIGCRTIVGHPRRKTRNETNDAKMDQYDTCEDKPSIPSAACRVQQQYTHQNTARMPHLVVAVLMPGGSKRQTQPSQGKKVKSQQRWMLLQKWQKESACSRYQGRWLHPRKQDPRMDCYSPWSGAVQGSRVQLGPRYRSKAGLKTSYMTVSGLPW